MGALLFSHEVTRLLGSIESEELLDPSYLGLLFVKDIVLGYACFVPLFK